MTPRVVLAAGVVLALGCPGACEWVTGPRYHVERALVAVSHAPLIGEDTELAVRFVSDTIEVRGDRAVAYTRGEVDGTYRGVPTSCICVEKVELARTNGRWATAGFPLRRLAGVTDALEARRAALERKDLEAYLALTHPDYDEDGTGPEELAARLADTFAAAETPRQRIVSRSVRVDRHQAIVTETYELEARVAGEPVRHEGRARYLLAPTPDGWRFTGGLM